MATNVFDPSQLSYYEPFGQCDIDMETPSGSLFGYLSVKIQFVPSNGYFLCPSCKNLKSHSPFMLFINLERVQLKTPDSKNRDLKMILRVGSEVASTRGDPSGQLSEHFMIDYSRIATKKNITITIYQATKDIGQIVVPMKDLLEGSVYDDAFSNDVVERAAVLLQLVYACSDCIVEKETADGELDIPVLEVASLPRSSLLPEPPRPSLSASRAAVPSVPSVPSVLPAERVFPTPNPAMPPNQAMAAVAAPIELQGGANIPGMSGFAPAIAPNPSPMLYAPQPCAVPSPMMYAPQPAPQPAPAMVMVPRDPRMEMAMMEPPMGVAQAPCYQVVGYQQSPYGSASGYVY